MPKMTFLPMKQVCEFKGKPSILEVALAHKVPLNHSCGGMGSCTTCMIHVVKGVEQLAPRNELENEHFKVRAYKPFERLGCQTEAFDGLIVKIPEPLV